MLIHSFSVTFICSCMTVVNTPWLPQNINLHKLNVKNSPHKKWRTYWSKSIYCAVKALTQCMCHLWTLQSSLYMPCWHCIDTYLNTTSSANLHCHGFHLWHPMWKKRLPTPSLLFVMPTQLIISVHSKSPPARQKNCTQMILHHCCMFQCIPIVVIRSLEVQQPQVVVLYILPTMQYFDPKLSIDYKNAPLPQDFVIF